MIGCIILLMEDLVQGKPPTDEIDFFILLCEIKTTEFHLIRVGNIYDLEKSLILLS